MKILALDTSTRLTGVALLDTDTQVSFAQQQHMSTHSEAIFPMIQDSLQALGWELPDIQGVVCGAGPGSFTGLRMGIASAKGLCFANHLPLVLVSSLEALAQDAGSAPCVLACTHASLGQVYARLVPRKPREAFVPAALLQDAVWTPTELHHILQAMDVPLVVCGDGFAKNPILLQLGYPLLQNASPHPLYVAQLGSSRLLQGMQDDVDAAVPWYAIAPLAEKKSPV